MRALWKRFALFMGLLVQDCGSIPLEPPQERLPMKKELSKKQQVTADFFKAIDEIEIINEPMAEVGGRVHKVYRDVLDEYLSTRVVIQFNFLEYLKTYTKDCKTPVEFKEKVIALLNQMKEKKDKTPTEIIEHKMLKRIYNDVVLAKGEIFEYGKDITAKYDNEDIKFLGFFNPEDKPQATS